jgi:hypothetical protein
VLIARKSPHRCLVPCVDPLEGRLSLSGIALGVHGRPQGSGEVIEVLARKVPTAHRPIHVVPHDRSDGGNQHAPPHKAAHPKLGGGAKPVPPIAVASPPVATRPPATQVTPAPPVSPYALDAQFLVDRLNEDRLALGLHLLVVDDALSREADSMVHDASGMTSSPGNVMTNGQATAQVAYNSIKASPADWATLTDPAATRVGGAVTWDAAPRTFDDPGGRANSCYMIMVG